MYEGGNHYTCATDALGSVRMLTGGSQNATETRVYDAWGAATPSGSVANPFEFTARPLDSSGLYDYRARRYDPTSNGGHRFTSSDPLGGGYAYAGDSPASYVDPTGMKECNVYGGCWYHGPPPPAPPPPMPPGVTVGPIDSTTSPFATQTNRCNLLVMGMILDIVAGIAFGVPLAATSPETAQLAWQFVSQSMATIILAWTVQDLGTLISTVLAVALGIFFAWLATQAIWVAIAEAARAAAFPVSVAATAGFFLYDWYQWSSSGC